MWLGKIMFFYTYPRAVEQVKPLTQIQSYYAVDT